MLLEQEPKRMSSLDSYFEMILLDNSSFMENNKYKIYIEKRSIP
jgi:hypothetical protein